MLRSEINLLTELGINKDFYLNPSQNETNYSNQNMSELAQICYVILNKFCVLDLLNDTCILITIENEPFN